MPNKLQKGMRKNVDFQVVKAICKEHGLMFDLEKPRGRGHPKIVITDGEITLKHPISHSPAGNTRPLDVRQRYLHRLKDKGLIS